MRLGVEIGRVRSLFRFALDADLIEQPVRYGANSWTVASRVRVERTKGIRMFEAADLWPS